MIDDRVTISAERYDELTLGWRKRELEHIEERDRLLSLLRAIADAVEPFSFTGPTINREDLPDAITALREDAEKWRNRSEVEVCILCDMANEMQLSPEEFKADAELGALVRKMPPHSHLIRFAVGEDPQWACHLGMYNSSKSPSGTWEHTPELALRSALKETE